MKTSKARQKELQAEMKIHQKEGNKDKLMELQKEMFSHAGETMKHSMKPMIITLIPILVFFAFIRGLYVGTPLESSWIWWYLLGSIVSSLVFRKVFRLP